MLTMFNDNPDLLKKVIIGDESWVYGYEIESKAQSFQWKSPFWSQDRKNTSNSVICEGYLRLQWRGASWIQKRTELWKNQSWNLRHDNAPVHTSMIVHEFSAKNKTLITVFTGLGARWLFPRWKASFATIEAMEEKLKHELLAIPKCEFQGWEKIAGISIVKSEGGSVLRGQYSYW